MSRKHRPINPPTHTQTISAACIIHSECHRFQSVEIRKQIQFQSVFLSCRYVNIVVLSNVVTPVWLKCTNCLQSLFSSFTSRCSASLVRYYIVIHDIIIVFNNNIGKPASCNILAQFSTMFFIMLLYKC